MSKSLFIVESPAKAKTLSRYLGRDFIVKATVGHIKDLPSNSLGVNVAREFSPSYGIIRGKSKVVQSIREASMGVEAVYLASDPDREGEAIAWHVAEEISRGRSQDSLPRFLRVMLHEITRTGLRKALDDAGELDRNRYESQLARRILDRLVGYELSPLLWKKVTGGLSAGRVQSVAVALVVDREKEILAFVPQEYWIIRARLLGDNPPDFEARLVRIDGNKAQVSDEATARPLIERLKTAAWRVLSVAREEKRRWAPPPFITSTLQQEAFRLFRFSTKRTMSLAQRLYEGVDMGEMGAHGLITYMRTDSTRLADEAVFGVRKFIEEQHGPAYLPDGPIRYKNKKSAQDAHEAIRPTSLEFTPEKVASFLDRDELKLYNLIWNRFVACQMAPARYDVTVATVSADERWIFEATGKVLLFDGYLKLYLDDEAQEDGNDRLPPLRPEEMLKLLSLDGEQQFTQPPPRFTEGTLVKELEKRGIGRPSTYATILSTIQEKNYVERDKGKFRPTDLGVVVTDLLRENFADVIDVGFTAQMEEELDRIEEGNALRPEVLSSFWSKFKVELDTARMQMKSVKREPEKTDVSCPKCSSPMVVRFGRKGSFLACSAFPECKTTLAFQRGEDGRLSVIEEKVADEKCDQCSSQMVLREGRFGRFWACSNYPKCRGTRPYSTGFPCPKPDCGGTLVEKKSKKNSTYYRCSRSPQCDHVSFGRPRQVPCPSCGLPYMEEKGRGKARSIRCPKCGHSTEALEAGEA
ncbi:MAG: type I DNA topoisomerase [Deltaproteobacteria bacterium]|nr:type I DNA topoisomerase [Deltaproteobacteria bacterium]